MIMIIISLIFTAVPLDFSPAALNENYQLQLGQSFYSVW